MTQNRAIPRPPFWRRPVANGRGAAAKQDVDSPVAIEEFERGQMGVAAKE